MKANTPPCGQGCLERKVGCHSSCERYAEWAKGKAAENTERRSREDFWTKAKGNHTVNSTSHNNDRGGWRF